MQPVKVGLIGCGNISAAYLRAAPDFPEIEIAAAADLDESRARLRAEEFGLKAVGVDAMLSDPEIEVILNLTIPQAHVAVGLDAIGNGKHVHAEKPLALSTAEAKPLIEAAKAKGLRVGSAPDTFLGGAHQTARALIDDGTIGKPLSGTAYMMNTATNTGTPIPAFTMPRAGDRCSTWAPTISPIL